jgi:PAS domain S-box-containing protein
LATTLRTTNLGRGLCLGGAALGAIGFVRWLTDADPLATIVPGQPPMMPNTALALLLLGLAGALLYARHSGRVTRWLSVLAAVATLAIGLGTIAEYAFSLPFSIDQILIHSEAGPYPGRPSPPVAFDLALLATAILMVDLSPAMRTRLSEWFSLCAGLIAFTALLAQAFGAGEVYEVINTQVVGVAVPVALSLLMISLGLLLERPDRGVMSLATSSGPGGMLLRRLAAVAILVPVAFGLAATWILTLPGVNEITVLLALVVMSSLVSLVILTNTAERLNRAQDAHEHSERQARDVINLASDGIFMADLKGRYVDANEAGCRMLGYTREEILGKTVMEVVAPEDLLRLDAQKNELLGGAAKINDWNLVRRDGSLLPAEVSTKILPDGLWLALVRDISERKRAEEVLRQAQERLELALKGGDLATWDWNIKTGEVLFNPRWAEMRGFRPEEIRPHIDSWRSGVHPDDWTGVQQGLSDYFEGTLPEYETTYRVATKSGAWMWIVARGRVFARDEQGRPTRMVGTERDVNASKRAEDEVRLSEAKFSGIVSISVDAIISIDEDQRITLFNEGAERIFGWPSAEAIGRPLDILIPERLRAIHARHVETFADGAAAAQRINVRGAIFGVRKNGEEFPADAAISRIVIGGKKILTVALRDITQMQEAEAEAKRASQARDDLLAVVAHDLRNPLAAIVSLAEVLRVKGSEREVGDEIASAANRMERLIEDLLDVTRMEAGRLSLKQERLSAAQVIGDALEGQTPLASSASLDLRSEIAAELPDILADGDRLLQVFENLIGNAIKFTTPGGRITVGATAQAGKVVFSVSDTGCGIASTHLPHVFDRFWQAPGAERRGMGFGLAIVKGVVEAHGGRVWVQSSPGQGSTFFFAIPRAAAQTERESRRSVNH